MKNNTGSQIARQSQIKVVQDYFASCGICPTLKDMVSITHVMVDFIENGYSKELGERVEKVDEFIINEYKGRSNGNK
jgi:hypothetical protein